MSDLRNLSISAMVIAIVVSGTCAFAYDAEFDYNDDGAVNELDATLILEAFNTMEGQQPDFDPKFDHDGDGLVGGTDISIFNDAVAAEQ